MKYHYLPAVNEAEFNRMAKRADKALIRRRSTDIVKQRNALLRELSDLRYKPRRTIDEDRRMAEVSAEVREIMLRIGNHGKTI